MIKEERIQVKKVWGYELWLVNNDEYCGKLLLIDRDAESSYHRHKKKRETFYCFGGQVTLTVEGKDYELSPMARAKTILPGEYHKFKAACKSVLIEISTHHEDDDSYRQTASKSGKGGHKWIPW